MEARIYLIRHGETEWSLSGRHTGRTDVPLSTKGEGDARCLRHHLQSIHFHRIFTSPRQRARQTCDLAGLQVNAEVEPALAEWDYGEYEGMTSAEIHKVRAGWNIYQDGCPAGESPDDLARRADQSVRRLKELSGNVALFSHGHFLRVFAARWVGLSVSEAEHFLLCTASISIVGFAGNPAILAWNIVAREDHSLLPRESS